MVDWLSAGDGTPRWVLLLAAGETRLAFVGALGGDPPADTLDVKLGCIEMHLALAAASALADAYDAARMKGDDKLGAHAMGGGPSNCFAGY